MTAHAAGLVWQAMLARPRGDTLDPEETQWLLRARAGEDAAYRWLLERYRGRMVRLAAHILRREADAEDVAQEAFVRAFRQLGTLRGEGAAFGPWLRSIVVRLCLDRRRRTAWFAEVSLPPMVAAQQNTDAALGTDTHLLIESLLDTLTPPLRAALILRELEGLEYDEIAQVLNVPIGTVRSRLHAARAQFRLLWLDAHREEDSDA